MLGIVRTMTDSFFRNQVQLISSHPIQSHTENLINDKFIYPSTQIEWASTSQQLCPLLDVVDQDIWKYISERVTVNQLTKIKWLQECGIWNINSGASWTSVFGHRFSFCRNWCCNGLGKVLANYTRKIHLFCNSLLNM